MYDHFVMKTQLVCIKTNVKKFNLLMNLTSVFCSIQQKDKLILIMIEKI